MFVNWVAFLFNEIWKQEISKTEGVGKSRFMLTMTTEHFIFLKMDIAPI